MKCIRAFIAICALGTFLFAPALTHAQDHNVEGGLPSNEKVQDANFTADALKDMLELDEHQIQFIKDMRKEMSQRMKEESEAMKDHPEDLRRMRSDMFREIKERVKEVLRPEQLEKYDAYLSQEKQRDAEKQHPDMHDGTDNAADRMN